MGFVRLLLRSQPREYICWLLILLSDASVKKKKNPPQLLPHPRGVRGRMASRRRRLPTLCPAGPKRRGAGTSAAPSSTPASSSCPHMLRGNPRCMFSSLPLSPYLPQARTQLGPPLRTGADPAPARAARWHGLSRPLSISRGTDRPLAVPAHRRGRVVVVGAAAVPAAAIPSPAHLSLEMWPRMVGCPGVGRPDSAAPGTGRQGRCATWRSSPSILENRCRPRTLWLGFLRLPSFQLPYLQIRP